MGHVVGPKADEEVKQRGCHKPCHPLLPVLAGSPTEHAQQAAIAVAGDEQGHPEKDHSHLQPDRQEDGQLILLEFLVTGAIDTLAVGGVPREFGDIDHAAVRACQEPAGPADQASLEKPGPGLVPQRVGHTQEALNAHSCQEEGGEIDGGEKEESGEGAEDEGQGPAHATGRLHHSEGQEEQQEQVRQGQVQQEHVHGHWAALQLAGEDHQSHQVEGEPHEEGEEVHGEVQPVISREDGLV